MAPEVGERIREAVERIDLRNIGVGAVTVSVGASVSRADGEAVASLVARADHALYRAKRYGRNRVEAAQDGGRVVRRGRLRRSSRDGYHRRDGCR